MLTNNRNYDYLDRALHSNLGTIGILLDHNPQGPGQQPRTYSTTHIRVNTAGRVVIVLEDMYVVLEVSTGTPTCPHTHFSRSLLFAMSLRYTSLHFFFARIAFFSASSQSFN